MAEIILPHTVVYEIDHPVSVSDVVAALLGAEQLLRETVPLLEGCIDGLAIERIQIGVREITQQSPLRAALFAALVVVYQKDLEKAVPLIADKLFGVHVPEHYTSVLTLAFCLLLFYGAETIYTQVNKKAFSKRIREQMDSVSKELSGECGISEERIKSILEKKYGKSRLRILGHSALSFFKPSKNQGNAPILIGEHRIDSETISEVPTEAQIEGSDVPEIARPYKDVTIELHAQDVDRTKQGWAGVVPEISARRLRMELEPPLKPEQIYRKDRIRGDIMLVSRKRSDGTFQPAAIHLLDIKE